MGIGVAGVNVVLVSIGELLLSDNWSYCVICSDRVRSKGRRQKKYSSRCWVGLCAVPCNKRYPTLNNYKRLPRYLIGQIAGQPVKKTGTCILLWHSNIYLTNLLSRYNPTHSLRSQNSGLLVVPRIAKSTKGGRTFSYLAPKLWNSLPDNVRGSDTLSLFKSRLKTHLFRQAFT